MRKKSLLLLLSSATLLFSCGGGNPSATSTLESEPSISSSLSQEDKDEFHEIYDLYVVAARAKGQTPLSYEDWLASIRGDKGEPGRDGLTPYIGGNGNWWIGSTDTGIPAQGPAGQNGQDGQDGQDGAPGKDGKDGVDGKDGLDGQDGAPGKDGQDGKDGASLLTGHGAPAKKDGKDGDSYVDLDSFDYYLKANGTWTLQGNIKGKDGKDASSIVVFYTVTFDTQGGVLPVGQDASVQVEANHTLTLPTPSKQGYRFEGWYTGFSVNDGKFTNATPVSHDITLYASYEAEDYHFIHFHTNGGSAVASQKVADGFTLTSLPNSERANYRFLGWYIDQRLTSKLGLPYVVTSTLDLYAKWEYTPAGGEYTLISTADDLASIYDMSGNYLLTADIDMSSYRGQSIGFAPYSSPFTGIFDGGGHRIYNYSQQLGLEKTYFGMFARNQGTIRNVKLEGDMVLGTISGYFTIGSLVALNEGIVENCSSSVDISFSTTYTMGTFYIGGLVGNNSSSEGKGRIYDCMYSGSLHADIGNDTTYTSSSYYNTIYLGGIAGHNKGAYVMQCVFAGSLGGNAYRANRWISCIASNGTIANCLTLTSSMDLTGSGTASDVSAYYDYATCTNCYRHVSVAFASGISVSAKGQAINSLAVNKPEFYTETLQFDPGIWNTQGLDYDNGVYVSLK